MSGFCRAIAASLAAVRHVSLMIPSETENWMQWEEVEEVEEVEEAEFRNAQWFDTYRAAIAW